MLFNDRIEVRRARLVADDYGKHRDWDDPLIVWSGFGAGVPRGGPSSPDAASRETSTSKATVYLPGDVAVDSADKVLFQDQLWQLEGRAWKWKLGSRRYTMLHVKAVIK
ncbi:hypothetical protein ACFYW9_19310 [Streptomyces sp. NPDC002698]|uniref:hypothetical protein n=1 Tax=Streptomyces sp. NPDC002698 TaxID=3364660 RepID=UPI003693E768